MNKQLPAEIFIKAAAALSGRDPGQLDEREALHTLQEYGREPQGEIYRQLTEQAASELFSDPTRAAEWADAAEHWDGETPDLIALALQRDLSPIIREKARKMYNELPQNDSRRQELEQILIATALSPEFKEAIESIAGIQNGIAEKLRPLAADIKGIQDAIAPALNAAQEAAAAVQETMKAAAAPARALSELFPVWEGLRESISEFLNNNPAFLLYDEVTGDLAPYIAEELKNPKYEGKTLAEIWDAATTGEDGLFDDDSQLIQLVNAARKAAGKPAYKEEPEHVTITRAQSIEYPLDKPNSIIWNLLEKDTKGQISFNMAKYGSRQQIPAYYAINFEELGNDITISKRLLPFDKRVYIAVSALFNAGNKIIALTQIYYAMGYTGTPGDVDREKIYKAINKMRTADIYFDNEQEATKYKYTRFKYEGALLPCEIGEAVINGKWTDKAVHIFREPPLITFAKQRKQITTVDVKLLQSPVSKTDANLLIDDYLIERISKGKNGKGRSCRILFKTLYEHVGIPDKPKTNTEKQQKKRAPDKVNKYLTHYQQQGFIKRFTIEKDRITVYW